MNVADVRVRRRHHLIAWMFEIPGWIVVAAVGLVLLVYSPNILQVYGIHNDYELLQHKNRGFFHYEAEALFAIARPVAALLSNLLILPAETIGDYRWTRLFSLLTLCFLVLQMIWICLRRLSVAPVEAAAGALGTFLLLPFIYSVLNAPAWPVHLLTIFFAFLAYAILSKSNAQAIPFLRLLKERNPGAIAWQSLAYAKQRPVVSACLFLQLAFYDYPPNALILILFPVIGVLFSRAPAGYRLLIAFRDVGFVGLNLAIFAVSAKLLYMPFIRLFTSQYTDVSSGSDPVASRLNATYRVEFNFNLDALLERAGHLLGTAADLWFLPQLRFHWLVGVLIVLVLVAGVALTWLVPARRAGPPAANPLGVDRLTFESWSSSGVLSVAIVVVCYLVACLPVLASATGFVTYRTIAVPTAVAAVVFLFAVRCTAETACWIAGASAAATSAVARIAVVVIVAAAAGANFYAGYLTMKLARNEISYFKNIVREALAKKARAIILIDSRPYYLPEDIPVVFDQQGRAVPPYELGCFSGYCLQDGSILEVAAAQLGHRGKIKIHVERHGNPVPGLTCTILTTPTPTYPPGASEKSVDIVRYYRTLAPFLCVTYRLDWHDIGLDPSL